jgi:hypothetical protein
MFSRPVLFFGVLLAAVAVPYILLDDHLAASARASWNRLLGKVEAKKTDFLGGHSAGAGPQSLLSNALGTVTNASIEEAFRFDLTPSWVSSRWPRVSTVLGEPKQLGMRVALISGTRPEDIAGSLTYYFDEHHQLQRITFTGLTGDPRRLLAAVVPTNGLKSIPTTDAAHYIAGDPKQPTSDVTVRHLPVLRIGDLQPRAEVAVDLRRADALGWRKKAESQPDVKLLPAGYRMW